MVTHLVRESVLADRISCAGLSKTDWLKTLESGETGKSAEWQPCSWRRVPDDNKDFTKAFNSARALVPDIGAGQLRTRLFTTGRSRGKDADPALLLAHHMDARWTRPTNDADVREHQLAVVDASERQATLPAEAVDLTDVLALIGPSEESITALYFRGNPARRAVIVGLAERLMEPGQEASLLDVALGKHPAIVEFWVFDTRGHLAEVMTQITNELLDLLLTANRPVAAWRANYFIPVHLGAGWQREWPDLAPSPRQDEKNYFLDEVNRLIGTDHPVWESRAHYVVPDEPPELTIVSPQLLSPLTAKVTGLVLHHTGTKGQTALLEWQCGVDSTPPSEPIMWQRYLAEAKSAAKQWSLAQLLDFHAEARFIKHHYKHEVIADEQFSPVTVTLGGKLLAFDTVCEGPTETTIVELLAEAFGLQLVSPVADNRDRAHAMASVVLDGGVCRDDAAINPLLASLACVDPYAPGGFYDDQFAEEEFVASQYRRFWSRGTYFLATSHSFAMLGFRQDESVIRAGRPSYVERKIHAEHMPTMYRRLFTLGLFQQLALDDVGRQLSLRADWTHHEDDLRDLRRQWIDLRAARWFTRVSSELQGEELYAHIRKAQQVDEDAALLDRKLTELEQVYSVRHDKLEKRRKHLLELIALPIAVFITFRETMYTGDSEYPEALTHLFEMVMRCVGLQNPFYTLTLVSCFIALFLWVYLNDAWRHPKVALKELKGWIIFPILMLIGIPLSAWLAYETPPFERHGSAAKAGEHTAAH